MTACFRSTFLLFAVLAMVNACGPSSQPGASDDGGGGTGGDSIDGGVNLSCEPGSTPSPEICDSRDNDCNGQVDDKLFEPNPTMCGLMTCYLGEWVSAGDDVGGPGELCNNHDDDCDELVDEDLRRVDPTNDCREQVCTNGMWVDDSSGGGGDDDNCDNIDNDCDGRVDEGFDGGFCVATCGGGVGFGEEMCINGDEVCAPADFPISTERCNNEDDDCDGDIDEGIFPQPCPCGNGSQMCVAGEWVGDSCTGCAPGTVRWCDEPQNCYWGKQTCTDEGVWGECTETPDRPGNCTGNIFDTDCCEAQPDTCCQDAFGSWESIGECDEQCPIQ